METIWLAGERLKENAEYIFSGDVGGTNTSLALVENCGGKLRVAGKFLFRTRETPSLVHAVSQAKAEISRAFPGLGIRKACLSAAGIVENNNCSMTNVSWQISGAELERELGIPVKIINDFTALSYALPLIDRENPREVTRISGSGGAVLPAGGVRAVAGAGTGLGIGCLIETRTGFAALASEGGHVDFAPTDEDSRGLCAWVARRIGTIPEAELFVSGQGLVNAFGYFSEKAHAANLPPGEAFTEIAAAPDEEKPALIARFADSDPGCGHIMRLFVRMYARVAANVAVTFIPTAGLFLAGGISAKNERWFLEDDAFMRSFLLSCRPKITALLATIPVYIIKDYGVSLGGAANAARYLMEGP